MIVTLVLVVPSVVRRFRPEFVREAWGRIEYVENIGLLAGVRSLVSGPLAVSVNDDEITDLLASGVRRESIFYRVYALVLAGTWGVIGYSQDISDIGARSDWVPVALALSLGLIFVVVLFVPVVIPVLAKLHDGFPWMHEETVPFIQLLVAAVVNVGVVVALQLVRLL